jgi:alginate O-acetyltransferase complex protein AlgI
MSAQTFIFLGAAVFLWTVAQPLSSVRLRQLILLGASYLFYANWGLAFLSVLVASSVINYGLGTWLRQRPSAERLWLGVTLNLLLLGVFKYLPPLLQDESVHSSLADFVRHVLMPVGISFWTFQGLSFLFDTYREEEIDPTLLEFCLYMAFWPTVLAGPVCRLPEMLPQLRRVSSFNAADISAGAQRLLIGIVMKMVLAQLLASGLTANAGVSAGFDRVKAGWGSLDVLLLGIGFGLQLFFDFAGYSHMVIGAARLFGFRLEENFDRPFLSLTPSVFWTRWHMSLSFWIRDYVFVPLAMKRRELWWQYLSLVFAMTLFGLWHAAKATFVVWGFYHGLLLIAHRLGQRIKRHLPVVGFPFLGALMSWFATFCLISLGWIFFRAHDLRHAWAMLSVLLVPNAYETFALPSSFYFLVPSMAIAYLLCKALEGFLAGWSQRSREELERSGDCPELLAPLGSLARINLILSTGFNFFSDRLWWWMTPAAVVISVFLTLAMFRQNSGIAVTPFMYTIF